MDYTRKKQIAIPSDPVVKVAAPLTAEQQQILAGMKMTPPGMGPAFYALENGQIGNKAKEDFVKSIQGFAARHAPRR